MMKRRLFLFPFLVSVLLFCADISSASAETASCQIEQSGKVTDCMEFSIEKGTLPASLEQVCALRSPKNVHWVKSPCPKKNAVGVCSIEKDKQIKQVVYCYKKYPKMPSEQAINYCKMGCKGTFKTLK